MVFRGPFILLCALAFAAPAEAYNLACSEAFQESTATARNDFDPSVVSFQSKSFNHAGLLLQFFGPMKNQFREWLSWLESDGAQSPPPNSPGLYYSQRGLLIAKEMRFPIDAGYSQYSGGDTSRRMIMELMEIPSEKLSSMKGSSPEAIKDRASFLEQLDTTLFGLYGALKSDTYANLNMRTTISGDHTLSASLYPRVRYRAKSAPLGVYDRNFKAPPSPIHDFDRVVEVLAQTSTSVTVKIKLGGRAGELKSENEELIKQMFFITHWQMVQKAYRETGLFKNDLATSLYLLDDFAKSMKSSGGDQEIVLVYDRQAWESMRFRMKVAHRYVAIEMQGIGLQSYQYQTIPDVFYPFYPRYGVAIEKHPSGEYELKRLFHNANPDPLKMLRPTEIQKGANLEIHHAVAQNLPPRARIKVISKSPVHTRLYKSVGFKLEKSEFNPEWNSQMDTLTQTRESFLEKTAPK